MYRPCTTEENCRRQQQMTNSLLDLMGIMPYPRITLADICGRVSLSRKTFYRYFDSKEDCLNALVDQAILDFSLFYPHAFTTPRPDIVYLEHYFTYWEQQRALLNALTKNQLFSMIYERTLLHISSNMQRFRNSPDFDYDFEQYLFMICGTTSLILNWHLSGYQKTAAQMAASVDRLISRNL